MLEGGRKTRASRGALRHFSECAVFVIGSANTGTHDALSHHAATVHAIDALRRAAVYHDDSVSMSQRRPSNPPLWRSTLPLSRKSSQAPSISAVFAEPEQSTPASGSAVQRLAPRMPRSRKRDRDDATSIAESTDTRADKCSDLISERCDEGAESGKRQRIEHEDGIPSAIGNDSSYTREPVGRKSSWFSFKSRNASRQLASNGEHAGQDTISSAVGPATTSEFSLSTRVDSSPSANDLVTATKPPDEPSAMNASPVNVHQQQGAFEPVPSQDSSPVTPISNTPSKHRSIWFTPQTPSRPSHLQHIPSMPLSIDDNDPSRPSTPVSSPTAQPVPTITSTQSSEPKLSSLNPSTSRFALSVPLLGRPKVPLDQVLEQSKLATEVENATHSTGKCRPCNVTIVN